MLNTVTSKIADRFGQFIFGVPGQLFDPNLQPHFVKHLSLRSFLCGLIVLPFSPRQFPVVLPSESTITAAAPVNLGMIIQPPAFFL